MLMAELYTYSLEKMLVTPIFAKPKDDPLFGFDLSKKCEHHFGAKGHTLEECVHLRHRIQDLIDNKLVQFNNTTRLNVIANPLRPRSERNMSAIFTVEERILGFSSPHSLGKPCLSRLIKSGQCYTPEELEKRRKEIGKGRVEPIRNMGTTEEAKEFLKSIRKDDYIVIQ
ncbi:hypothetical protein SO802_017780 [Lithocarpus litseifolius]|uniref:Gag-pro-like protein n=1 Tax=Lithocarpus litseifolius TaxID=425828 RepID=A0AAW2CLB9_9ROSI